MSFLGALGSLGMGQGLGYREALWLRSQVWSCPVPSSAMALQAWSPLNFVSMTFLLDVGRAISLCKELAEQCEMEIFDYSAAEPEFGKESQGAGCPAGWSLRALAGQRG